LYILSTNEVSGYESGGSAGFDHNAVAIADESGGLFGDTLFFFYMKSLVFEDAPMYRRKRASSSSHKVTSVFKRR
jgi:hypothetical protein